MDFILNIVVPILVAVGLFLLLKDSFKQKGE
jgi:hypothetical protein